MSGTDGEPPQTAETATNHDTVTLGSGSNNPDTTSHQNEDAPYDYLRDGPVRYCGYANEVGEAFRHVIPSLLVSAATHCKK